MVLLPSLSGGKQVLDNSMGVCRDDTVVEPIYVLKDGTVIIVALCFPNGKKVFQVYLHQAKEAQYNLVPTRQPLQLGSVRFGRVLNVLLIGEPFLVSDAVPGPSVLPPGPSTVASTPFIGSIIVPLAAVIVILCSVFCCIYRRKKGICCRSNRVEYAELQNDGAQPDDAVRESSFHPDARFQGTVL